MKKKVAQSLLLLASLACSIDASANDLYKYTVGLDMLKTNSSFEKFYGKGVFKEKPTQYALLGQYNLSNNFFLELGYRYSIGKGLKTIGRGENYYPGQTSLENISYTYNSKIKQQFPYIGAGWNYSVPGLSGTYVSLLGGLSLVKVNGWFEIVSDELANWPSSDIASSRRTFNKSMPSAMIKAAINHKFNDHFGVRLSAIWQKLDHFKLNSSTGQAQIRLKNSSAVGVGIFYSIA